MKFPMKFEVEAVATSKIGETWESGTHNLPPITSAIPVEFMGPGGGYSPEDYFGLAVLNCVVALYKVYCEKSKVQFAEIRGKAVVTADKQPSITNFVMSHVDLTFVVSGAADSAKARTLLEAAIKDCPVGNSIKSGKTFHIQIL